VNNQPVGNPAPSTKTEAERAVIAAAVKWGDTNMSDRSATRDSELRLSMALIELRQFTKRTATTGKSAPLPPVNAHLIAAAPDLLEVCKQWVKYFDALDDWMEPDDPIVAARRKYHGPRVELTRAAIAKATPPASPAEGAVK
jgi:hypothetical protein